MFDLIGFWGAVTLIIMPTVLLMWWLVECLINMEVKHLSKRNHKFEPFDDFLGVIFRKSARAGWDIPLVMFMIFSIVASAIALLICAIGGMVDCDTGVSFGFVESVSRMAVVLAPVAAYITTPLILITVYSLTVRKLLVKLFDLKEKIDKL